MNEIVKNHISQVINEWLIGEKKYALESRAFVCIEELANSMLRMTFNPHCSHPSCNSLISNIQIF